MGAGKDLWTEFEARYCKQDWAGVASLFADDAVHVDPTGRHEGSEQIAAWLEEGCAPFFDISFPASHLIEQGDTVVAEYVFGPLTPERSRCQTEGSSHRQERRRKSPASRSARSGTGSSSVCATTSTTSR
jgi:ketosteroid isomerase-like protein